MENVDVMEVLLSLAREVDLPVRVVGASSAEADPPTSATCRVRGVWWVILSSADPPQVQIDVLAGALREHAGTLLEDRYLPPAVRARLASRRGSPT